MSTVQTKETVIALLGQPNSGKSTLFNGLTGLRQHVGNWPGKTVEQKEGYFTRGGVKYTVADLPGTYSLYANSDEEIITRDYIAGGKADVVVILADASQLERSLFMLADFAGIETPAVLLLNLMDVAQEQGKIVDAQVLEKKLGIRPGSITPDGKFSLDACRCVGACGLAPVMMVGSDVYGRLTPDQVGPILDKYE